MKARYYLIASILWMAIIWILSSIPASDFPDVQVFGLDKVAHLGVYLIWGFLLGKYVHSRKMKPVQSLFILSLMLLLAALDEYHQIYIPGRSVSIYDLFANWSGVLAAWLGLHIWHKRQMNDRG